jgi:hypothetical protein
MTLPTKLPMKPRHMALGAALLGAALLAALGDRTPDTDVAEAVERPATAPRPMTVSAPVSARVAATPGAATSKDQPVLALVPREVLLGDGDGQFGQDNAGQDGGAGGFGRRDWNPPPPPPQPQSAAPPPPPMAPPLPFTFIGKSVGDGAWEVYLARGDRTYVVRADTVIDGTYRVDAIAPPVLTLTYLPLNQVQQLNIGVFE